MPWVRSCVGTKGRAHAPSCSLHVTIRIVSVPTLSWWIDVLSAVTIAHSAALTSCSRSCASLCAIPSILAMALDNFLATSVSSDIDIVLLLALSRIGVAMC